MEKTKFLIFVEQRVLEKEAEAQGFSATFEFPKDIVPEESSLRLRPIFRYADYIISAAPAGILHDSNIMPITSYTTNGVGTFISGASVVGTAKCDSTVYHIGNYLPVPATIYESQKRPTTIIVGSFISEIESIIGTWAGECNSESISIIFNDDECSGTYVVGENSRIFTYSVNNPQSGDVRLLFDDDTTIVITRLRLSIVQH